MSAEEEIRGKLQELGRFIKTQIPPEFGFILLIGEKGEDEDHKALLYLASIERSDALQVMREFIAVNREERNWQREMPELELEEEFDAWWAVQIKRTPNYSDNKLVKRWCRDAFIAGRTTA
jgi:hypothetical protein